MSNRARWALTGLFAILPLLGWWATGLFDLDEGFYAAVVAEMNRRGEWITPYFNGHPWFEKPILLYWLAKPSVALFGEMVGPRLPSVLCTLGVYALVGAFVRRRMDDQVARLSVLLLASSLLVAVLGRLMMTDAPLLLALTAAYFTFWESLVGDRRWRIVSAACIGIGILAKGPVAALLFLPVVGWTFYREREMRPAFRGYWLVGVSLLLVVVATWYVPAYLANGQTFVQKFLIEQNIGRFTGGDAAHTLGWKSLPAYIPIVFLGMFPWSLGIFAAWPRKAQPTDPLNRFLWTWAITIFLFFSISGAKLPHYILPVFPPLAILVARILVTRPWAEPVARAWCAALAIIANVGLGFWYGASGQAEAHTLARYIRAQGGDVAVFQLPRRQKDRGTGGTKLQETSLPSLLLYLNGTAIEADKVSDLTDHPGNLWVFTRPGRISLPQLVEAGHAGRRLERIQGAPGGKNFELWRLR